MNPLYHKKAEENSDILPGIVLGLLLHGPGAPDSSSSGTGCLLGGLLGGAFGLLTLMSAVSGNSQSSDSCSDHDDAEPHYGYRYGRWYYGKGHSWGCENEHKKRK